MADKQTFETVLSQHPGMNATGITIPFDVEQIYGAKRVPVKAYINGTEYRGSIARMGSEYCLGIPKQIREMAGIRAGDHIVVTIVQDNEERIVPLPDDLSIKLSERDLLGTWYTISFTQRKEMVRSINDAKQAETRDCRIEKALLAEETKQKQ